MNTLAIIILIPVVIFFLTACSQSTRAAKSIKYSERAVILVEKEALLFHDLGAPWFPYALKINNENFDFGEIQIATGENIIKFGLGFAEYKILMQAVVASRYRVIGFQKGIGSAALYFVDVERYDKEKNVWFKMDPALTKH